MSALDGKLVVPHILTGWRLFRVEGRRFVSLYFGGSEASFAPDDRDWHRATCRAGHEPPNIDCECGFYAWTNREGVASFSTIPPSMWWAAMPEVIARVHLAGRVIIHDGGGYRAQCLRLAGWWPLEAWVQRVALRSRSAKLREWAMGVVAHMRRLEPCRHCRRPGCVLHRPIMTCRACGRSTSEAGCWFPIRAS